MARFHDMVGEYNSADDENKSPTIFDDLTSEYDNAFNSYQSATAAKDQEIAKRDETIAKLQSRNYELLEQVSTQDEPFNKQNPSGSEDAGPSIENLFVRKS